MVDSLDPVSTILPPSHSESAKKQLRNAKGHFIKSETLDKSPIDTSSTPFLHFSKDEPLITKPKDPPLVALSVTNPITYFKLWWNKIIGNEGMDLRIKVKPLTALAIVFVIASGSFGIGFLVHLANQTPIVQYVPALAAPITPNPIREGAYSGKLEMNNNGTYFLITNLDLVIKLEVPQTVNLTKLTGKRILATGQYNTETQILYVTDAKDLEVLPTKAQEVPITTPYLY